MHPGAVEAVAYQETLMIMAVFGVVVLAMVWAGFRRWLQYKDKMSRLIAEQTAEISAQSRAQMERVETRLTAIERVVSGGGLQTAAQIEASAGPGDDRIAQADQVHGQL